MVKCVETRALMHVWARTHLDHADNTRPSLDKINQTKCAISGITCCLTWQVHSLPRAIHQFRETLPLASSWPHVQLPHGAFASPRHPDHKWKIVTLLDRPSMLCGSAARTDELRDGQDVRAGGVTDHPSNIEGARLCRTQCRLVNVVEGGSLLGSYTEMLSLVFLLVVRLLLLFMFLLPPHHTTPCERRGDAGGRSCRAQAQTFCGAHSGRDRRVPGRFAGLERDGVLERGAVRGSPGGHLARPLMHPRCSAHPSLRSACLKSGPVAQDAATCAFDLHERGSSPG